MNYLKAVILDWAGTTVDFGCHAPVAVLQQLFAEEGVPIHASEARRDMGLLKLDHIRAILGQERIAGAWRDVHGRAAEEADAQRMFQRFGSDHETRLAEFSGVIPGVSEAVAAMRGRGLRIGATTGYTRAMLAPILERAAGHGYLPDASVTPDEAAAGRPAPWMIFRNLELLGVYPASACVKIGDTPTDMEEGSNAGCWTVGVLDSGNQIGRTAAEWDALSPDRQNIERGLAREVLLRAGADFTVNTLADLPAVLDEIEARLSERDAEKRTAEILRMLAGAQSQYFGEPVTQLEHAIESAELAMRAQAGDALIAAALLHDIGHVLAPDSELGSGNHEEAGARFLEQSGCDRRVVELVRGHVAAKRYLVATDSSYAGQLSEVSIETLRLQGGPMSAEEVRRFEASPLKDDLIALRRWDEAAKIPGASSTRLESFQPLLRRMLANAAQR